MALLDTLRPGGHGSTVAGGLGCCGLAQTCPPFSPARTVPVLPTVTLHPSPDSGHQERLCRQEERVREGPGREGGGGEPFFCTVFYARINCSMLAKAGGCSLQGGVSPGPRVHPCQVESKAPHPWPSERSYHPPMASRTPTPPSPCYCVTLCPGRGFPAAL